MDTFVLIKEAQQQSDYTADHIRYLLGKKLIAGRKIGGVWLVDLESLRDYEAKMDEAGTAKYRPKSLDTHT